MGTSPGAVAIAPDGSTAYVVDTGSNQVTPIDVSTGAAASSATWIGVGNGPAAIALAPDGVKGYVVDESSAALSVITLSTHSVSTVPLSPPSPSALDAIALTPDGTTALVVDGINNTVTPVTLQTDAVGTPVGASVLDGPDAIAVGPTGAAAYVVDGGSSTQAGGITPFDLTGAAPVPDASVTIGGPGDHPDAIALSPDGSTAYVLTAPTNGDAATVTAVTLNGTSVTAGTPIPVASATALRGIAVTPDGSAAYATGTLSGSQPVVVPARALRLLGHPRVGGRSLGRLEPGRYRRDAGPGARRAAVGQPELRRSPRARPSPSTPRRRRPRRRRSRRTRSTSATGARSIP